MNGVIGLLVFVIIPRELENGTELDLVQILLHHVVEGEFIFQLSNHEVNLTNLNTFRFV